MQIAQRIFSFLAMLILIASTAFSQVKVKVLDQVMITQCHYYGFFPSLHMLSTGDLICAIKMDGDKHDVEGNFWAYVISNDKGKTWGMRNTAGMVYKGEAAYTRLPRSDGSILMLAGYGLPTAGDDYNSLQFVLVQISNHGQTLLFNRDVRVNLPKPSIRHDVNDEVVNFASLGPGKIKKTGFVFFSGDIIEARDGGLLTLMYGKLVGDLHMRTIVVKSNKEGKTWEYVTTLAGDKSAVVLEGEIRTEGFTEPRMIRLDDGRLFAAIRRGSNNMIYKSWSNDDGKTWTNPVSTGFRGVKPALWLMKNGVLALSTGRPDPVTLYLSTDGGENWTNSTVIFRERGTRYTDLVEIEPNKLLVVYDHVPFNWGVIPDYEPKAMNTIYGTFIEVTR